MESITPHYVGLRLLKLPDIVKLCTCLLFYDYLRTFPLIVSAQRCCADNATVIRHASLKVLRLTSPEDKNGVENPEGKISGRLLLWIIGDPIFLIMNHMKI